MKRICCVALLGAVLLAAGVGADDAPPEEPAPTINTIMLAVHRPKPNALVYKVEEGRASDAEKRELLEAYERLSRLTPPKGDAEEWSRRTEELVAATRAVIEGEDGATARLAKARDCRACHDKHK